LGKKKIGKRKIRNRSNKAWPRKTRETQKSNKTGAEKRKIGKEENWETMNRIGQGIFNREGRGVTRRGGGKDETLKSGKLVNGDPNRPRHFGPRKTRNDAKGRKRGNFGK